MSKLITIISFSFLALYLAFSAGVLQANQPSQKQGQVNTIAQVEDTCLSKLQGVCIDDYSAQEINELLEPITTMAEQAKALNRAGVPIFEDGSYKFYEESAMIPNAQKCDDEELSFEVCQKQNQEFARLF